MELEGPRNENIDFAKFMPALKRVIKLQRETVRAQIEARQKRRIAGFKRRDVSNCDAALMKEVQKLTAQGKLKGFDELLSLAEYCQEARDGLGPLEEEGVEAEQRLEGDFWRLRKAQENLFDDFREEIHIAENYSSVPSSGSTSPYESVPSLDSPSKKPPEPRIVDHREVDGEWETDSGFCDLDRRARAASANIEHPPSFVPPIYERYPRLLTDFDTKRDRINKWLLNTTLLSRMEATVLKSQLEIERSSAPSSWAELAIANWGTDAAAFPPE